MDGLYRALISETNVYMIHISKTNGEEKQTYRIGLARVYGVLQVLMI